MTDRAPRLLPRAARGTYTDVAPAPRAAPARPEALRGPLLKVPAPKPPSFDEPDEAGGDAPRLAMLHAVASGTRSCLVKVGGEWWRLKGSGSSQCLMQVATCLLI